MLKFPLLRYPRLSYIVPRFPLADLLPMLGVAVWGAVLASLYGVMHDQWTYSISPEYFTKMKFQQFHYANFGWGERAFVATIGVLATWWVGMFAGWLLARRFLPHQPRTVGYQQVWQGFAVIFACTAAFTLAGHAYGLWRGPEADYSAWNCAVRSLKITDLPAFVHVAYIHNASYLGSLAGLIVALVMLRPPGSDQGKSGGDETEDG